MRRYWILSVTGATVLLTLAKPAGAKPIAPIEFCETYPQSMHCIGRLPACTLCHTAPPKLNEFGMAISDHLMPDASRPLSDAQFVDALADAMDAVASADTDGDGVSNLEELERGTLPGDALSNPAILACEGEGETRNPDYNVCEYDPRYVFKKIYLDMCGHSPSYEQFVDFLALNRDQQMIRLEEVVAECVDSEFWLGKNGVVWQLAHDKIRPFRAGKSGEDPGQLAISDYYDDYHMYVYAQIDDHDARLVLTADYFVKRVSSNPTVYEVVPELDNQLMQRERRVGLLTTHWSMVYNVMSAALARTAAAQAYRAFLGFDISRLEGLYPIEGEPKDYDDKDVDAAECALCHSTLDPLTYPFRNYNGFTAPDFQYSENRLEINFPGESATIGDTPESGYVLGKPVANLIEWGQVAANSSEFLMAAVGDYWELLIGNAPETNNQEFTDLWQRLGSEHQYSIERMLHDFIKTEAYGVP